MDYFFNSLLERDAAMHLMRPDPAAALLGLRHIYTKPYTPRTNGKAERFIQTALREWASLHRADHLPIWLHRYNWHRPHGSIGQMPPISRLGLSEDNLLRLHT